MSPRHHFVVSSRPLALAHLTVPFFALLAQQIDALVASASRRRAEHLQPDLDVTS